MENNNDEISGLRTKLAETLGEHKMLLDLFKLNQQMKVHIIVCQDCKVLKPCQQMASIAEGVRRQHSQVEGYYTEKDRNAKS